MIRVFYGIKKFKVDLDTLRNKIKLVEGLPDTPKSKF